MITVYYNGKPYQYADSTKYLELARTLQPQFEHDIVLASVNGKLQELWKYIKDGASVSFLTTQSQAGIMAYRRSVVLLLLKALKDTISKERLGSNQVKEEFSLSKGLFCHFDKGLVLDEEELKQVQTSMEILREANYPIEKYSISTEAAIEQFGKAKMTDKERLFRFRRASKVNIYSLDGLEDYYYGYMVPSTGYLKYFKLYSYEDGFVLQMPVREAPEVIPEFEPQHKLFKVMRETGKWGEELGVATVGELNELITGKTNKKSSCRDITDLILVQEALMEKRMAHIADAIAKDPQKKIILIAGPSSSGKTTFSYRLSVQLKAAGLRPHPIGVDNYFVDREKSPKDADGNYNYEDLECIDVAQFNQDMEDLLQGKTVSMPTYNFITGRREYKGNFLRLGPEDILVIEGIHCLNEKLYPLLPKESIFRIYISALTQLNIDEHNRIPTTDGRLIRRMVRDARTRGASAQDTIAMWNNVRKGEEKNIFPYQETADVVFNSALIYELAVLKPYAEPLLFGIDRNAPEYSEAKRLLKFFDYFVGIDSQKIPINSILREFIGGSCFNV